MQDPNKIRAWHLSQAIAVKVIYALDPHRMRRVPGLRSQTIRAATSVAANITEGCARSSTAELNTYIERAVGSLNELETDLKTIAAVGVIARRPHADLTSDIGIARGMLLNFSRTLRRSMAEEEQKRREKRRKSTGKARPKPPLDAEGRRP
jgi:four helix bundle protein